MKSSYLLAGTRSNILFPLLKKNKIIYNFKHINHLLFLLQNAFWSSFFSKQEINKYKKLIDETPLPENPIFIIGHWRTGSTFIHQLLTLDDNFITPTLFQTFIPEGYKTSYKYYKPLMKIFLGNHRPFDNIKAGMNEPQEDEFALMRMSGYSPLLKLVFPEKPDYFLKDYNDFMPPKNQLEAWEKAMEFFYKKITYKTGKRLLIKNPFHSMRVKYLIEKFPGCKFIHIYRNPLDVVPSTIKMWDIVAYQNKLNNNWARPTVEDVSDFHDKMLTGIHLDFSYLPVSSFTEVCFEKLEADPIKELKVIYNKLGIIFTPEFEKNILSFIENNNNFKKNSFQITDDEKEIITSRLKHQMIRYGYL